MTAAIKRLTDEEWNRLHKACCVKGGGTSFASAEDFLVHVVNSTWIAAKTGKGGRRWRKGVPFMAHLMMTIKGQASDDRKSANRTQVVRGLCDELLYLAARTPDILDEILEEERMQLQAERAQAVLEAVRRRDEVLDGILRGIDEGKSASEIREQLKLTKTEYESARKRLRRLLEKLGRRRGGQS